MTLASIKQAVIGSVGAVVRSWAGQKAAPGGMSGGMPAFMPTADAFRRRSQPSRRALLDDLRGFPFACASKNANGVASVPLRLYVKTNKAEGHKDCDPFWSPRPITRKRHDYLAEHASPDVRKFAARSDKLEEITTHPILDLFAQVNPWMNQYDLMRMLSIELDSIGEAYWFLNRRYITNDAGIRVPGEIWPLEAWRIRPLPSLDSARIIDGYEYSGARGAQRYDVDDLIQFRFVSPHDPYATGFSPMRAAFEFIELANELLAFESSVVNNRARPDMLISPNEMVGRHMAQRLEQRFNERFRRGGAGGVLVGEFGYRYDPFNWSPADLGNTEIRRACEEVIAACFDVPLSLVRVEDVNRANAEANKYSHADLAIRPRCVQIEQKLNERMTPIFDNRLILAFDNPVPDDADAMRADVSAYIGTPVETINEGRAKRGDAPVRGGDEILVPPGLVPLSQIREMAKQSLEQGKTANDLQQAQAHSLRNPPPGAPGGPDDDDDDRKTWDDFDEYIDSIAIKSGRDQ